MVSEDTFVGLLLRIKGADYFVEYEGEVIRCVLRGKLRIAGYGAQVLPVVGDRVRFRYRSGLGGKQDPGLIMEILPRRSVLVRMDPARGSGYRVMGANMDRAILVFSYAEPKFNSRMLDRMIVASECGSMEPVICLNKVDLAPDTEAPRTMLRTYRELGYRIIYASAVSGEGIEELSNILAASLSIMVGPSGTGKSSLASKIQPGLDIRIGSVSTKSGKGKHTTSHFELHRLSSGGYLGDSPGVREFGIWGITQSELGKFFREFRDFSANCKYPGCTHSHEPGCAVKEAVVSRSIDRGRYESYLRILATLQRK